MVWTVFQRLLDISNIALVAWPSGAQLDLSPEDEEVKQKLVKCAPLAYSELIKSDILGLSGARPARLPFLRPSPLSVMKPSLPPVSKSSSSSILEPFIVKPTRGELRARLEVLAKKKRSVKKKSQASPEGCAPAQGKILKAGPSSLPSSFVGAGDSSGRGGGGGGGGLQCGTPNRNRKNLHGGLNPHCNGGSSYFGLESHIASHPPSPPAMPDEVRRDRFGAVGGEDSLLSHEKLASRVVSSIVRDSDLKKMDALSVEVALALLLQGTASVRPSASADPFLYCFSFVN